jgi:hypothetical protein
MTVIWKTIGWSQQYRIFRDKIIVGILKKEGWKQDAVGEYNGAMVRFSSRGFWKTETIIADIEGTKELGKIEYDGWKSIGKVIFQGEEYLWKYDSWKLNEWTISKGDDFAKYKITNIWKGEGAIEIEGVPPELVIIGLYIEDRFKAISAS